MKETKEKLLQTATELFAKYGINGVSTRVLAKESGVNLSSINYYFGSKQKLYDAVLESIKDLCIYRLKTRTLARETTSTKRGV